MAAVQATTRTSAEAVLSEVAILEATLREAAAERRTTTCPTCYHPRGADLQMTASSELHLRQPSEQLDAAIADYGVRMRSWVDQQVDARISQVLRGVVEGELLAARHEAAGAMATVERLEGEVCAAAEAQSKLLGVVEGMSEEVTRLKAAVSACQLGAQLNTAVSGATSVRAEALATFEKKVMLTVEELRQKVVAFEQERQQNNPHTRLEKQEADLQELRRQNGHHERCLTELQRLGAAQENSRALKLRGLEEQEEEEQAKQRERLARQLEAKFAACRAELHAEVTEEIRGAKLTRKAEERLDLMLDGLRSEVAAAASLRADLEERLEVGKEEIREHIFAELRTQVDSLVIDELKGHVDMSQGRLSEDLAAAQNRLFADLRAETTAAFRSEAAAVAALDEQLWLTDQRLGQRIDEIAHLHLRDRVASAERRCRDVSAVCANALAGSGSSHTRVIEEHQQRVLMGPSTDGGSSNASPRGPATAAGGGAAVSSAVVEGVSSWWRRSSNELGSSGVAAQKASAISEAAAERARLAAAAVSSASAGGSSLRTLTEGAALTAEASFCEPIAVTHHAAASAGTSSARTVRDVQVHQGSRSSTLSTNFGLSLGLGVGGGAVGGAVATEAGGDAAAAVEGASTHGSGGGNPSSPSFGASRGGGGGGSAVPGALASWLLTGSSVAATSPTTMSQ